MLNKETTLEDFLENQDPEVAEIVDAVAGQSIPIRHEIPHRRGDAGTQNIYGEDQKALDVWVNDLLTHKLIETNSVYQVVSEENPKPILNPGGEGEYTVAMDPLDGSSNVKSNNLFGTIIGVYKSRNPAEKGRKQVAAFYKLYGPMITIVLATEDGVYEFAKARKTHKKYFLINEQLRFPEPPKLYGVGGNPKKWVPEFRYFVDLLRDRGLKNRYGGSFVGDFNQVLKYGGFFGYPALLDKPRGKLRLVFEGNPMSFIAEKAGGLGSTGAQNILDIEPREMDERIPIYIGNMELISELEKLFTVCKDAREQY
ncbi:MAG: class 1 fructose-bisphosphatase [Candidatus Altiarchaeales archaeon]|nr:class 1 fructose-bisphosphatase [Candidatus Altiarchaeales archaeon]